LILEAEWKKIMGKYPHCAEWHTVGAIGFFAYGNPPIPSGEPLDRVEALAFYAGPLMYFRTDDF
jgi:hypothetical protein